MEMFGLCGAGKTTAYLELLRTIEEDASIQNFYQAMPLVPERWRILLEVGRFSQNLLLRSPGEFSRLLISSAGRWLMFKLGYRVAGLRFRGDVTRRFLKDSGILQPLISFDVEYNTELLDINMKAILELLPLPSYAVYGRIEPDIAMKRYVLREEAQGKTVCRKSIEERFHRGHLMAEQLYQTCGLLGIRCSVLDLEAPVSKEQLRVTIQTLFQEGDIR